MKKCKYYEHGRLMRQRQLPLPSSEFNIAKPPVKNGRQNQLRTADRAFHDWYRFVLSFPPHLVQTYIDDFGLDERHTLLDPFCGTGTTLIEAKIRGIPSIGLEANPFAAFASSVKLDWDIDHDRLLITAKEIANRTRSLLHQQGVDDEQPFAGSLQEIPLKTLAPEAENLLLTNSISPLPLHKTLLLLDHLKQHSSQRYYRHLLLALANALVFKVSNLHFGPEVGVGKPKDDVPVLSAWLSEVEKMAGDLRQTQKIDLPGSTIYSADARQIANFIAPQSIDAVITSPPYPNEKDYTRTTRLESVILGFIKNKSDLQTLKKQLIRSNTRGVYKEDHDDEWASTYAQIQILAETIEKRRLELGKTSGFEKLYGRVTQLYFGGMVRHLTNLRTILHPGAKLAYVVGDQASYLRVMIPTGQLLADIAQSLGYEIIRVDLFRTRLSTATREQLREEVVVMKWNG